ncbi:hypothetical protein C7974DRAFT_174027 [Boeremia exigua]|uniref:uncharacterized protein n=1 Tax=Boeremia exigua TaxID=749465 RepID=UPI001E8E30A5|nr:uncharacterized protein C7974DRAFT_174027 [Boeremia exigua]KAH6633540.1 hypothetical protein C7974DRAFT_174027 [Boeremia exigua]
MSAQSDTPTPASMQQVVEIPAVVSALGPHLSRLPDELLYQIFKFLVLTLFPAKSRFNKAINPDTFKILNQHSAINRIRNVSIDFTGFFMEAFYENFHFVFAKHSKYHEENEYLTSIPPPIPRRDLRHHLRSMRVEITLENYFWTEEPGLPKTPVNQFGRKIRKVTTGAQMLEFCPSARFLLHLTNPDTGFSRLRLLDLHIRTNFAHFPADADFFRALDEVNFVVSADEIKLTVTKKDEVALKPELEAEVRKMIVVVRR